MEARIDFLTVHLVGDRDLTVAAQFSLEADGRTFPLVARFEEEDVADCTLKELFAMAMERQVGVP